MCGATEWYSKVSDVNLKMRIHWNSFSDKLFFTAPNPAIYKSLPN